MDTISKFKLSVNLLVIYFFVSLGIALQISGSNWDIIWHSLHHVESFFTLPHSVIYLGVTLSIGSTLYGIIWTIRLSKRKENDNDNHRRTAVLLLSSSTIISILSLKFYPIIAFPLRLVIIGSVMQLFVGPFDFWWHTKFGFDGLLSPPHFVLAAGMFTSALGALIGIYEFNKDNNKSKNNNNKYYSYLSNLSFIIALSVFWMVSIGVILLFTLPFSKGQYFDFNPNLLLAVISASTLIPIITEVIFFVVARINTKMPFLFSSIAVCVMVMQSTATIISNPYFIGNFGLYLLNIFPAITGDIILLRYRRGRRDSITIPGSFAFSNKNGTAVIIIIASTIVSIFSTTIFYPWTLDLYKHYFFGLKESAIKENDLIFHQLLIKKILPTVMPAAAILSILGGFAMSKLTDDKNTIYHRFK